MFDIELERAIAEGFFTEKTQALLESRAVEEYNAIQEAKSAIDAEHLRIELLEVDKLIERNNIKEVTNPIIFQGGNIPTPDGLLSNQIFGITRSDRANTCAYIDLTEWFISPHLYKVWSKLDKNVIACVYGTNTFKINEKGVLVEDPDGETGIKFLKKNFQKISITRTTSLRRDENVNYIEQCQKEPEKAFIRKMLVIPAYYRDVDTSKKGKISVGELNELYRNLIIAVRSLKDSGEYGLTLGEAIRGRIQGLIVQIFDWFGTGTTVNGNATGAVLPGKIGVMRQAVMSKTTDYANRLILSAPDLRYEKMDNAMVNMDYSALPLSSTLSTFMPFIVFNVKNFFANALSGGKSVPELDDAGNVIGTYTVKDYQIQFSEDRIKKEINRFISGYSNRFIPVEVETTEKDKFITMRLKGYHTTKEDFVKGIGLTDKPFSRKLTWCDVFYIAAVEAVRDKHILVTRYPIDSAYNQFTTKIHVNSTVKKAQVIIEGEFYPYYPLIEDKDIGTNTSNKFVDTLNLSNLYLAGISGDYDGDTATVKGIYTNEANAELDRVMNSKYNYITTANKGIRTSSNEAIQSLYNLTFTVGEDESKMTKNITFA